MTAGQWVALALGALAGLAATLVALRQRLRRPVPPALIRVNVNGRQVPAVLGGPVVLGAAAGLAVSEIALLATAERLSLRIPVAVALILVLLYLAGSWDDRRGNERPRGFAGHLAAARLGQMTGGVVKLLAGVVTGLAAGLLVGRGWGVIETALLVALSANLVNLFDRAPGRAAKVALVAMVPLALLGAARWAVVAAGSIAALVGGLPADLEERAMLGDAGANPLGGVLGLGLAVSLPEGWRLVAIALLVGLNLASERWSFSSAIERVGPLNAFDRMGRR